MEVRVPGYAPLFLFVGCALTGACGSAESANVTAPGSVVATQTASLVADPAVAQPQFFGGTQCPTLPPFGFELRLVFSGAQDVILQGLSFTFTERTGRRVVPRVVPVANGRTGSSSSFSTSIPIPSPPTLPNSPSIPVPGASPIPIPGAGPITGLLLTGGTEVILPFVVTFGCDVLPDGNLIISADTAGRNGNARSSQLTVRVAG